jgi:hypothetical protein
VEEEKVSRHKSDCCGWFVVSSRARTARIKQWVALLEISQSKALGALNRYFSGFFDGKCDQMPQIGQAAKRWTSPALIDTVA